MSSKVDKNRRNFSDLPSKSVKYLKTWLPITTWMPLYKRGDLIADIISGVTVGLTVVPQSMAYAGIAGLPPEYGLYSSYIGCLLYVILGSCRQVNIGPTAVMGLLTFEACGGDNASCAILAGFYSGVFEMAMAILQLGWVVSFISEPVTIGFTAGAATTIFSSQIKNFLGIGGSKGAKFLGYWSKIFSDIKTISFHDSLLGIGSLVILLLLRKLKDFKVENKILKKTLWLLSVGRNALIICLTSILACIWTKNSNLPPFKLTGYVRGGFPQPSFPPFELPIVNSNMSESLNGTFVDFAEEKMSFLESISFLGTGPLVIALISVLQNVAISKAFGAGQSVDATQEMFALGMSNLVGGFFSAIPTSGSFSRAAVNHASGVRSPFGGLFTGILVLLSLGFLTPSFYFIPKSSLSAVIIGAVIFMIDWDKLKPMWKISKIDLAVCIVTYLVCLLIGMEIGIVSGVGFSLSSLLFKFLRPQLKSEIKNTKISKSTGQMSYLLINPQDTGIHFPSADYLRNFLDKSCLKNPDIHFYILNFEKWTSFDYTTTMSLTSLAQDFEKGRKKLIFFNPNFSHNYTNGWLEALEIAGLKNPRIFESFQEIDEYIEDFIKEKNFKIQINVPLCDIIRLNTDDKNSLEFNNNKNTLIAIDCDYICDKLEPLIKPNEQNL